MKLKKLWASILVLSMLFSFQSVSAAVDEFGNVYDDPVYYWEDMMGEDDFDSAINSRNVTDEISTSNTTDYDGRRTSGQANDDLVFQVVDSYDQVSNSYYAFNQPVSGWYYETMPTLISGSYYGYISGGYYETDPTDTPEPTATATPEPTVIVTPEPTIVVTPEPTPIVTPEPSPVVTEEPTAVVTEEPTATPEPTATATPEPTIVVTPEPTATATPEPTVVVTATPTPKITATPSVTPELVTVPRNKDGIVYVIPEEKTPTKVTYNIDLEVGRLAHITPTKKVNTTKTSSDTHIINDPRSAVGSFNANDYEARANNPGDATLTFYNSQDNFTEEWNVHVFCRPLDFEKTEYVVEKPKGRDGYITLFLKYFEYEFEYAYAFEWSSSNKDVAYVAGGDQLSTFCRFCVRKPGVTIITVKDKYGNSSQCALVVKDPDAKEVNPTPEPTATPEPTPEPTVTPEPTEAPEPTKAPDNGGNDELNLTAKQLKTLVKASGITLKLTSKAGKIKVKYSSDNDLTLDGYQIQVKTQNGKSFKTKKTVKNGSTLSWNYTTGKNKTTYQFRVRGYKLVNGKKVYTKWSKVKKAVFKKAKAKG